MKRDHYEPLHRSLMEFTAAFYIKSLSDKNQQKELEKKIDDLFENNSESLENILKFALEMLASDNACSDILTRIPKHGFKTVSKPMSISIGDQNMTVTSETEVRPIIDQVARMRLLQIAGHCCHMI